MSVQGNAINPTAVQQGTLQQQQNQQNQFQNQQAAQTGQSTLPAVQNGAAAAGTGQAATPPSVGTQGNLNSPVTGQPTTGFRTSSTQTGALVDSTAQAAQTDLVPFTALPVTVQNSLRSQLNGGQLGNIQREVTPNGVVYRANVSNNGQVTEFQMAENGVILSQGVPTVGVAANVTASGTSPVPQINGTALNNNSGIAAGTVLTPLVYEQLPLPVQASMRTQIGTNSISNLTLEQTPAGPVYRATIMQNGQPMEIRFAANGGLIPNPAMQVAATAARVTSQPAATNSTSTRITFDELPEAVQRAIRNEAGFAEVTFVSRETSSEGESYRVIFRSDDEPVDLRISDEGTIMKDSRNTPIIIVGSTPPLETNQVTMSNAPEAIRRAIRAHAGQNEIYSVTLTNRNNETVYEVEFRDDFRRNRLVIAKDGTVQRLLTNVVSPVIAAAVSDTATGLRLIDLPMAAQETIQAQAQSATIKTIEKRTKGGQVIYDVLFTENGEEKMVSVASDGLVMSMANSGAADSAGAPASAETGSNVDISQIPEAVQRSIKNLGGTTTVEGIQVIEENGVRVYEVEIVQDERKSKIRFGAGGMLIVD
ncbi:MAG: PepSY-like domain-containing protein [Verrucomicrobiota bacterium]|nr:PepSY-like domain-containing protein [Verrucomicrobiota bacterium]